MSGSAPGKRSTFSKATQQESVVDSTEFSTRFRYLLDMWGRDTLVHSFPQQIYRHWAYEELVSLDEPAIPDMLEEIHRGSIFPAGRRQKCCGAVTVHQIDDRRRCD